MNNKSEGIISTAAAILVLFSSMLDPKVSIIIAVAALMGLSLYSFNKKGTK